MNNFVFCILDLKTVNIYFMSEYLLLSKWSYLKLQAHSDQQITFLFRVTQFFHHGFYLKSFLSHMCMNILALQKQNLASAFWFKINSESKSQWNRSVS
ncbi:hypothetical protein WN943_028732 [Citrus x changshan-huyou]